MFKRTLLFLALGLSACDGCGSTPQTGWYRAWLTNSADVEIPFFIYLPTQAHKDQQGLVVNGEEKISITHEWEKNTFEVSFMVLPGGIQGSRAEDGSLKGHFTSIDPFSKLHTLPFKATPVIGPKKEDRFSGAAPPKVDISGDWAFEFEKSPRAQGIMAQSGAVLSGTIYPPTEGDYRFLAGDVQGRKFHLSAFDGVHVFLLEGEVSEDGRSMSGRFFNGEVWRERFKATRKDKVNLDDPFTAVRLKEGATKLSLPALKEEPYAGKPTIVELFGTWCPNCNDAAPVLVSLRQKYRDRGLQVLGVAFEFSDDLGHISRQLAKYKKAHGSDWKIIRIDGSVEDMETIMLPELEGVHSFPVTMFLKADGTVHAIYAGFAGPATGAKHEAVKKTFDRLTQAILSP